MRAVGGDVLVAGCACASFEQARAHASATGIARAPRRDAPHPLERPEEVDRGRPRGGQPLERDLEIAPAAPSDVGRAALPRGQHDAVGRRHADRRRAAHHQRADRRRPRPPSARTPARAPARAAGADRAGSADRAPSGRARCGWPVTPPADEGRAARGSRRRQAGDAHDLVTPCACRVTIVTADRDAGERRWPAARPPPRWPDRPRAAPRPARSSVPSARQPTISLRRPAAGCARAAGPPSRSIRQDGSAGSSSASAWSRRW